MLDGTLHLALLRHGPAEAGEGLAPGAEALRALTPRGRRKVRRVRAGLARAGLGFDRLLTSPLRRAVQTADLLQPLLAGPCDVEPLLAAPPGEALLARLRGEYALPGGRRLLLVGHEPHLSALAAWLVHGEPALGAGLRLRKAGLLLLEGEPRPGGMRLVALLPPGLARRLGRG